HDATLFMALVAAFHLALARVSGQDDIVIGTPLARRDRPEWEDCVGFFASALPLRVRAAGDLPLDEALTRVRAAVGGAFAHQDLAFEQIVDAVGVRRSPDRHPIFQACLVLQNMPVPELTLAGLRATRVPDPYPVTPFDLWLSFDVTEAPATARLLYRRDRIDAQAAQTIAREVETLLAGVVSGPSGPTEPSSRRHRPEGAASSDGPTIVQRIVSAARRTPDATALVFESQQVSYRMLERGSARLARR